MATRIWDYLSLAVAYTRLNLNAHLEYRAAFVTQVVAMFINDSVWVAFWAIFFTRFPVLRGWTVEDVITVWALTAAGFGLAHAIYGNALPLATIIAEGQLDVWMLYPRTLLPHLLLGRMNATAWGDALFGYVVYVLFVRPDLPHFILFAALTLSSAILLLGFYILSGSLSFYLGNAAALAEQWRGAMLSFSTYPAILFDGFARMLLFTLVPAGFVTYFPIEALRSFSLREAGFALSGAAVVLLVAILVFYAGLRRYESGNLMEMRG